MKHFWEKASLVLTGYTIYKQLQTATELKDEFIAAIPEEDLRRIQAYVPMIPSFPKVTEVIAAPITNLRAGT